VKSNTCVVTRTSVVIVMAQQGAALQTYNNELVKSMEELLQRRAALQAQIEAETAEKTRLEAEKARVEDRLGMVDTSLQKKLGSRAEYDRLIQEAEQSISSNGMSKLETKIGFVGGGAMAQAIAEGLVMSGTVNPANIMASATTSRFKDWWTSRQMTFMTDNHAVISSSEVVFVSVKPHLYLDMLDTLNKEGRKYEDKLWVSIMAGVVLTDLTAAIGKVTDMVGRVVRSMPNTPVKVRKGSIAVTFSQGCSSQDRDIVNTIFSSVGRCTEVPERLQNAFAAMAGSGPAYIYQVIEALADGGVMMGLPRDLAMEQAAAMVEGAASMVLEGGKHPAALKDEVCSPGGSTIRGVQRLEQGGVRAAFMSAVQAAAERNEELGKK